MKVSWPICTLDQFSSSNGSWVCMTRFGRNRSISSSLATEWIHTHTRNGGRPKQRRCALLAVCSTQLSALMWLTSIKLLSDMSIISTEHSHQWICSTHSSTVDLAKESIWQPSRQAVNSVWVNSVWVNVWHCSLNLWWSCSANDTSVIMKEPRKNTLSRV